MRAFELCSLSCSALENSMIVIRPRQQIRSVSSQRHAATHLMTWAVKRRGCRSISEVTVLCVRPRHRIPFTATRTSPSCNPTASALLAGRICSATRFSCTSKMPRTYGQSEMTLVTYHFIIFVSGQNALADGTVGSGRVFSTTDRKSLFVDQPPVTVDAGY